MSTPQEPGTFQVPAAEPAAPEPTPTPEPAPEPESRPGDEPFETEAEAKEVWDYDPFKEEPEAPAPPTPAPAETPPTEAAPTTPPAAPAEPAPADQAPQPAAPPEPVAPSEIDVLKQQLAEQKQLIDRLSSQPPPAPAPAPAAPAAPAGPPLPPYNFDVPDEMVASIASDDPTVVKAGLNRLMQGLAQSVHHTMRQEALEMIPNIVKERVEQTAVSNQSSSQIFNDFYTTYPQYNREELKPFVMSSSQEVMKETGMTSWGPGLRDAIARRVQEKIASLMAPVQPAPVQQVPLVPAPVAYAQPAPQPAVPVVQPPQIALPGASPGAANPTDISTQVNDLLFGR